MLTQEQRVTMSGIWLSRWQGCTSSGISMAEYAKREGFDANAAYRWRRILRRTGQWVEADGSPTVNNPTTTEKSKGAVRFARVAVSEMAPPSASMLLRVVLTNGRRAELEIGGIAQLGEVLGALERAA